MGLLWTICNRSTTGACEQGAGPGYTMMRGGMVGIYLSHGVVVLMFLIGSTVRVGASVLVCLSVAGWQR